MQKWGEVFQGQNREKNKTIQLSEISSTLDSNTKCAAKSFQLNINKAKKKLDISCRINVFSNSLKFHFCNSEM